MTEPITNRTIVDDIFDERKRFIVLGLTGQTGAGCSSVAELLCSSNFKDLKLKEPINSKYENNDGRRYRIAYDFLKKNWGQFTTIRVRDVIVYFCLNEGIDKFQSYLDQNVKSATLNNKDQENLANLFRNAAAAKETFPLKDKLFESSFSNDDAYEIFRIFSNEIKPISNEFIRILNKISDSHNNLMQQFGNNIRLYGSPYVNNESHGADIQIFGTANIIRRIIKAYRVHFFNDEIPDHKKKCYIVIDAIRNPYEAFYLKERFSSFYLIGVTTKPDIRTQRLNKHLSVQDIAELDNIEQNEDDKHRTIKEIHTHQDVRKCLEAADIFIANDENDNYDKIKSQLVRYLSLIMHPGIVPPTAIERCMQIAHTSKLNSGCISRQVGAVVTDNEFAIKAVGWNNTPRGQVPCILRNFDDLMRLDKASLPFSSYEQKNDKFREHLKESVLFKKSKQLTEKGLNACYCFKDAQNTLESQKNQVHTRSLHAEENAFLQISKYGGEGVKDGYLFTTASPCELCSKKAFQLGIKRVYYIDPYPGISIDHVLGHDQSPELHLFSGAIGRAYVQLYQPIMSYKDEIHNRLGEKSFSPKEQPSDKKKDDSASQGVQNLEKSTNPPSVESPLISVTGVKPERTRKRK